MRNRNMRERRFLISSLAFASIGMAWTAAAQTFPSKPVRMIAPEAGGGADLVARVLAQGLTDAWKHQAIVDNRGGAAGIIAAEILKRSAPDGYTLLFYGSGILTLPLMKEVPYDPIKDFAPITLADSSPTVLVVHPSVPA